MAANYAKFIKGKIPNPLDYVDGKAAGKYLKSAPMPKFKKTKQGPAINIDAVVKGDKNKKLASKYPKSHIPKGKI